MSPKLSALKFLACASNLLIFVSAKPTGYNYDHVGNYVNLENTYMSKPGYHYSQSFNYPQHHQQQHPPQSNFQGLFGQDGPLHPIHHPSKPQFQKTYDPTYYQQQYQQFQHQPYQTFFLIRVDPNLPQPQPQQFPDLHGNEFDKVQPQLSQASPGFVIPDPNGMIGSEPTFSNPNVFTGPYDVTPPKMTSSVSAEGEEGIAVSPNPNVYAFPEQAGTDMMMKVPSPVDMTPPKMEMEMGGTSGSFSSEESDERVEPQIPSIPEIPKVPEIPQIPEIPEQKTGVESAEIVVPEQTSTEPTLSTTTTVATPVPSSSSSSTNENTENESSEKSLESQIDPFRPVSQDDAIPEDDGVTTQVPDDEEQSKHPEKKNTEKALPIENIPHDYEDAIEVTTGSSAPVDDDEATVATSTDSE